MVINDHGLPYSINLRHLYHFKEISDSQSGTETIDESAKEAGNSNSKPTTPLEPKQWSKRDFERRVRQVIRRYRKRSII